MFFKKKVRKPVQPSYTQIKKTNELQAEPVKKETKRVKKEIREAVSEENKTDEKISE